MINLDFKLLKIIQIAELAVGDMFTSTHAGTAMIGIVVYANGPERAWLELSGSRPFMLDGNKKSGGMAMQMRVIKLPFQLKDLQLDVEPSSLVRSKTLSPGHLLVTDEASIAAKWVPQKGADEELYAVSLQTCSWSAVDPVNSAHAYGKWQLTCATPAHSRSLVASFNAEP